MKKFFMWLKEKLLALKEWIETHFVETIIIGSIGISAMVKLTRAVSSNMRTRELRDLKDRYIYDRSNGAYIRLKRSLRNNDWIVLDDCKKQGMTLVQALNQMRVLK